MPAILDVDKILEVLEVQMKTLANKTYETV